VCANLDLRGVKLRRDAVADGGASARQDALGARVKLARPPVDDLAFGQMAR
jgi:hypothetical protein